MALETNVDLFDLYALGFAPVGEAQTSVGPEWDDIDAHARAEYGMLVAEQIAADQEWAEWEMIRDMSDYYDGTGRWY